MNWINNVKRIFFLVYQKKNPKPQNCSQLHELALAFNLTYNATQLTVLDII